MPRSVPVSRCAAFFIVAWLLPFLCTHTGHAVNSSTPATLEGHVWLIPFVAFEPRSRRGRESDIYPGGENAPDAYLSFENGIIGGNLGCGEVTGQYNLLIEKVQISAGWTDSAKRCSSEFRTRTENFITALNGAVRAERKEDGSFHLFDEQKNYFVRLELLSVGVNLSENRRTFWRLANLEGNIIAEPDAEVRFDERRLQISLGTTFSEQYSILYNFQNVKFRGPGSFKGTWSAKDRQRSRDAPPLFEAFEKVLYNITRYTIIDDKLTAFDSSDRQIMLLERIRSTGLEHRFWHIHGYATEQGMKQTVGHPKAHTITFAQGEVQGTAACKGYQGDYTMTGDSLSVRVSEIASPGYCPRYAQDEDLLVVEALNKISRAKPDGSRMLLQDGEGMTRIVLLPYLSEPSR